MLRPGYRYTLPVTQVSQHEVTVSADQEELKIPRRTCPEEIETGHDLDVFIFIDRNNEIKATTRVAFAQVDEFAFLQVESVGPHGAFLSWGIEKDLLCPHPQQEQKMLENRRYLVRICCDESGRPIASSRLDRFLEQENSDLQEGQEVEMLVWAFTDLGAKVIINNRYEALLYRDDIPTGLRRGDKCTAFVRKIRDDRRIDIGLSRPGAAGVKDARGVILEALAEEGFLDLHDQSSPELIQSRLGLSKKVFKKAVGGLYKDKIIRLDENGISLI